MRARGHERQVHAHRGDRVTGDNQRSPRVSNFALLFFSRTHPVEQSLANIIIIMGDYSLHTPLGGPAAQMSPSYDSIDFACVSTCETKLK